MAGLLKSNAFWASIACFLVAFVIFLAYQGVLAAGMASYEIQSAPPFGRSSHGWTFGTKTVYLRKGQTFTVAYDVQIKRGGLTLHLLNRDAEFLKGTVAHQTVWNNGTGEWNVPIQTSGWHVLILDATPDGGGYDLEYSASWRTRSAP